MARFEGGRHQQRPIRRLCRLDYLRAVPAALRRAGEGLAACRYLRLDPVGETGTAGGGRVPGCPRALPVAERTLWMTPALRRRGRTLPPGTSRARSQPHVLSAAKPA